MSGNIQFCLTSKNLVTKINSNEVENRIILPSRMKNNVCDSFFPDNDDTDRFNGLKHELVFIFKVAWTAKHA